jgi:phosphocarrier protein
MPETTVTVSAAVGLHARPAARFTKAAAGFPCQVTVVREDREADAKSMLALLTLDVRQGDTITIRTAGEREDDALAELERLVAEL